MLTRCDRASRGHAAVTLWVVMGVALSLLPSAVPSADAYAQQPSRTMNGIAVSGRFLEVWSSRGSDANSVYVNGLPITARRSEISLEDGRAYETQWFERARYELHPENPRPHDVLLGRLGAWDAEGRGKIDPSTGKAARAADAAFVSVERPSDLGPGKLWFPETRHTLTGDLLDYWARYGGISQFGFPLSEPFTETSRADGKPYTVQYFERARMELHPEKPEPYRVELGLLGVEQVGMKAVPADELPVAPPKGVMTKKDTVKVALTIEPADISFIGASSNSTAVRLRSLVEDEMVGRDENENLFPLNAWYVPTLENGGARFVGEGDDRHLQVKYKLRQGIKWSDGQELTSSDAVFAYRLLLDPNLKIVDFARWEMLRLAGVDNPDKHTVIYSYRSYREVKAFYDSLPNKEAYPFLRPFVEAKKPVISKRYSEIGRLLPEHVLKTIKPEDLPFSSYVRAPIGTGPWRVERWTTGQTIIFLPNEHYSLTAKPPLKKVEVKLITDVNGLEAQFKTGNIDIFLSEAYVIPPADKAGIEAAGGRIVTRPGFTWEHLDFSLDYEPFKDRKVREAVMVAINRQRVVDVAFRGAGAVMNSVVPSTVSYSLEHPSFSQRYPEVALKYKLPLYTYNPARAVQLLEEAGWRCPVGTANTNNCDRKPREKGGQFLQFEYATTINAVRQQTQGVVQADLRAVGIDAQVKSYPASVFFDSPGPRTDGTTKLTQLAWVGSEQGDFDPWVCRGLYDPGPGVLNCNPQRYINERVNELNDAFNASIGPQTIEAAAEAQVILMQDLPTIPLVQRPKIEVVTRALENYKLPGGETSSFWNARQWRFK